PIDILRMDVLNVFRRPCDVGEVSAGTVLTALWLPGGATRIHQEQRVLGRHFHWVDPPMPKHLQHVVHDEIATFDQWRLARISARLSLPHEHLLKPYAFLFSFIEGGVCFLLVI